MELLGARIDALTIDDLHETIARAATEKRRWIIAHQNMHSLHLQESDSKMRSLYREAHCVHVDGMSLILLGRLLGLDLRREHRVTYADWIRPLLRFAAQRGLRVFYLGSRPGVAERAAATLRAEIPTLRMATHHGHFDPADTRENGQVLGEIARFGPDVLLVGMGMPRQEHWVLDNVERIEAHAILTSGACMDYVAGEVPTPPRWMGRLGIEWLYRLGTEPRRLWRRYLIEPWLVLAVALRGRAAQIRAREHEPRIRRRGE